MQYTANYGLKKPMGTDVVNITDLNDNADITDQKLKENKDAIDTKETPAGAQAKADSAETKAKAYADSITPTKVSQLTNDKGYITASGAPVQSVNGKTGAVSLTAANVGAAPVAHVNDTTVHMTSAERSAWNAKPSSQRAVSDSISSTNSSVAASSKAVKTAYDKANQAFQSASDGKSSIATAITGMGGTASSNDSFTDLANAITNISTGKKFASGTQKITIANYDSNREFRLINRNLNFRPFFVFVSGDAAFGAYTIELHGLRFSYYFYWSYGGYGDTKYYIEGHDHTNPKYDNPTYIYDDGFSIFYIASVSTNYSNWPLEREIIWVALGD